MTEKILTFIFILVEAILIIGCLRGIALNIKYKESDKFKVKHTVALILIAIYLLILTYGDLKNSRFDIYSLYGASRLIFIAAFFIYSIYSYKINLKINDYGIIYGYSFWSWENINNFEWERRKLVIRIKSKGEEKLKILNVKGSDKLEITNLFNHYLSS